jgi:hypothetical protein
VADQQPVGVAVDRPGLAGGNAAALVGVVGLLEAREVGHGPDAVQVHLEQLAEAAGGRAELLAGLGAATRVADQQVAGPAGEPEVDRAGGGDAALLGDRGQAGEPPVLGPLGDPGHGAAAAEADLAALGARDARPGAARPGLGDVQGAVGPEPDPARVVEAVGDDLQPAATAGTLVGGVGHGPGEPNRVPRLRN